MSWRQGLMHFNHVIVSSTVSRQHGLNCLGRDQEKRTSSEKIDQFVTLARGYLTTAYPRISQLTFTSAEYDEVWRLVRGVEAAVKLRRLLLEAELAEIDQELEGCSQPC
jgi:hypothetical protein